MLVHLLLSLMLKHHFYAIVAQLADLDRLVNEARVVLKHGILGDRGEIELPLQGKRHLG